MEDTDLQQEHQKLHLTPLQGCTKTPLSSVVTPRLTPPLAFCFHGIMIQYLRPYSVFIFTPTQ